MSELEQLGPWRSLWPSGHVRLGTQVTPATTPPLSCNPKSTLPWPHSGESPRNPSSHPPGRASQESWCSFWIPVLCFHLPTPRIASCRPLTTHPHPSPQAGSIFTRLTVLGKSTQLDVSRTWVMSQGAEGGGIIGGSPSTLWVLRGHSCPSPPLFSVPDLLLCFSSPSGPFIISFRAKSKSWLKNLTSCKNNL